MRNNKTWTIMNVPPQNRRTVEQVFRDFKGRHTAIVKALTTDLKKFYFLCNPDKENLCLFGYPNEHWEVTYPNAEVPPELPEPAIGINFSRDGMRQKDWLSLVAVHSDAWLIQVAFYFGSRFGFDSAAKLRLFDMINELPTVSEIVCGTLSTQVNLRPLVPTLMPSVPTLNNSKFKSGGPKEKQPGSASRKKSKKAKDWDEDVIEVEDADGGLAGEDTETLCGACGEIYTPDEFWICCDKCDKWFHGKCVKITEARADHMKHYKCPACSAKRGRRN